MPSLRPLALGAFLLALSLFGGLPGLAPREAEASTLRSLWERLTGAWRRSEGRSPQAVPELDPGAAGQAMGVVVLGAALLLDRRRARAAALQRS